jgi:hypothetical protein
MVELAANKNLPASPRLRASARNLVSPGLRRKWQDAPMGKYAAAAVLAVRLLGLAWMVAGLWLLAANFIESAGEFDPSFIGYYFLSQALRPLLAVVAGLLLWLLARPLGRRAARGLDADEKK